MGAIKLEKESEYEIDDIFYPYWDFLSKASFNPQKYCENLCTEDFIKFVSLRNHKSRGADVENRIAFKNNWKKMGRSRESGDLIDADGRYVEVKSSIVTPNKGSGITLRGFRNWEHEVHHYVAVILDIRDFKKGVESHIFNIPKSIITPENGFKSYNQSRKSSDGNKNVPLGITFGIGDKIFSDWERNYRTDKIIF